MKSIWIFFIKNPKSSWNPKIPDRIIVKSELVFSISHKFNWKHKMSCSIFPLSNFSKAARNARDIFGIPCAMWWSPFANSGNFQKGKTFPYKGFRPVPRRPNARRKADWKAANLAYKAHSNPWNRREQNPLALFSRRCRLTAKRVQPWRMRVPHFAWRFRLRLRQCRFP